MFVLIFFEKWTYYSTSLRQSACAPAPLTLLPDGVPLNSIKDVEYLGHEISDLKDDNDISRELRRPNTLDIVLIK